VSEAQEAFGLDNNHGETMQHLDPSVDDPETVFPDDSMRKPEVKSFHTLIFCAHDIVFLLSFRQCVPLPIPHFVAPNVKGFHKIEQYDVEAANP
jgi:hypothetical protein